MKKTVLIVFALFIGLNVFSQTRRDRMGNPQISRQPSEQDIEKRKRLIEERKEEYIANFLTTLEADDFQKEITKQTLNSFFDAKMDLLKTRYEHPIEREQAITKLETNHFKELKELISKNDMEKIQELIKGEFDEKEVVKKRKRRRKNRSKN